MLKGKDQDKKVYGAPLPVEVIEAWDAFTKQNGYRKWQAVSAAFSAFQMLPDECRVMLMGGDCEAFDAWLDGARLAAIQRLVDGVARAESAKPPAPPAPKA